MRKGREIKMKEYEDEIANLKRLRIDAPPGGEWERWIDKRLKWLQKQREELDG